MINNRQGFTLIEFLVSIVILMVGLLGMLQGINLAMEKSVENVVRDEALAVADDFMMYNRNKTFASLSTTVANPAWDFYTLSAGKTGKPQTQRYVRGVYKNYSVQQIVNSTTSATKEVIINVAWKYRNKRSTHSISSFVSTSAVP